MAKKILIDAAHKEETRVVVVDGKKVEEFDFETQSRKQIVGNIYLARVARIEPALQAVFVEFNGDRHGFLPFSEIHPDYYQIPVEDKELLNAELATETVADAGVEGAADAEDLGSDVANEPKEPHPEVSNANADAETEISGMQVYDAPETSDPEPAIVGFGNVESGSGEIARDSGAADEDIVNGDVESALDHPGEANASETTINGDDSAGQETTGADPGPDEAESVARAAVREQIRKRAPFQRKYKVQEVIRSRQVLLVQAIKEARGSKGASLSTYISLAGRYCVLMPNTARGGGISRKISNPVDRKKLKQIAEGINVPEGAGLIIRTAGAKRTKQEIKRDYDYLLRQWDQIRLLTFKSIAPTPIYEEGGLIKRAIRDIYTKSIDSIIVEGDEGYRVAKDFMKLIMPSHAKKVQQYAEQHPLYSRYQIEGFLGELFNPVVQLPSGGYLVIGITEALVAIDVNSGRATSQGTLEQTALQTNLEAAEEIARQVRLRDLAGIIVIDFIDMPERKHNAAVEKRLKEHTKIDRARIQLGRISGFGLLEFSRQRLRPGIMEAISAPCKRCNGTGLVRSDESLILTVLRQLEATGMRRLPGVIRARLPIRIANSIMNEKREAIARIEQAFETKVRIEADARVTGTNFHIEVFRPPSESESGESEQVVSIETSLQKKEVQEALPPQKSEAPKRKRRKSGKSAAGQKRSRNPAVSKPREEAAESVSAAEDANGMESREAANLDVEASSESAPRRRRRRSRSRQSSRHQETEPEPTAPSVSVSPSSGATSTDAARKDGDSSSDQSIKPAKKPRRRRGQRTEPSAETLGEAASAEAFPSDSTNWDGNDGGSKGLRPSEPESPREDQVATEEFPAESAPGKRRGWWSSEAAQTAADAEHSPAEGG